MTNQNLHLFTPKDILSDVQREITALRKDVVKADLWDLAMFLNVPARDEKGVSVDFRFCGTPVMKRSLNEVLFSRQYPWESSGDVCRTAVAKLLYEVATRNGNPVRNELITALLIETDKLNTQAEINRISETITQTETVMSDLAKYAGPEAAREKLREMIARGETLPKTVMSVHYVKQLRGLLERYT